MVVQAAPMTVVHHQQQQKQRQKFQQAEPRLQEICQYRLVSKLAAVPLPLAQVGAATAPPRGKRPPPAVLLLLLLLLTRQGPPPKP